MTSTARALACSIFRSSAALIENNIFADNDFGLSAVNSSSTVRNNIFSNNLYAGINLHSSSSDFYIYNNVIYDNETQAIKVKYNKTSNSPIKIHNNTIYQQQGSAIWVTYISEDVQLLNNILVVNDGYAISVEDTAMPTPL